MIEVTSGGLIHSKMIEVMRGVGAIAKGEKNTHQGFNFRGIDTIYNELHGLLSSVGIFTMPEVISDRHEERQSRNGGILIYRILTIKYRFYAEDGTFVESVVIGEGMDSGDKASNKAMSIAHKYCLLQCFCIPTKEIKDPDYETHEIVNKNMDKSSTDKVKDSLINELNDLSKKTTLSDIQKDFVSNARLNDINNISYVIDKIKKKIAKETADKLKSEPT